jgi:hypothetical protein
MIPQTLSSPSEIAKRIRALIARHDQGDVVRAAQRLALPVSTMCQLERFLAADSRARANLLASVIHRYGTEAVWLLTGQEGAHASELAPETRRTVTLLLSDVSDRILSDYWSRQSSHEVRAPL